MLTEQHLTEFAKIMEENKPYLLAIDNEVQRVAHGEVTVRCEISNGRVRKMQFIDPKRTWLEDKAGENIVLKQDIVMTFVRSIEPL